MKQMIDPIEIGKYNSCNRMAFVVQYKSNPKYVIHTGAYYKDYDGKLHFWIRKDDGSPIYKVSFRGSPIVVRVN